MANDPSHVRAVLFDAVGTLIYADPPVVDVYQQVARSHGVEIPTSEIAARIKSAIDTHFAERTTSSESIEQERWRTIVADVFQDATHRVQAIFDDLWLHFAAPQAWQLYSDVEDCFAQLRSQKIHGAIASNFDARLTCVCQGHNNLRDLKIYCSSELGFAKPHANFFRAIEDELGLSPHQLVMVGDDRNADYIGAKSAGWMSVHLVRDRGSQDETISTLCELPALLAS